ncbi:MAG: outer membrane protein assembly factor BamE [Alphaproteobacteria bacterium]|nr:outer membrane protein assembly factor BamE [Alphaproteobacteria bacterium]MBU0858414.1 outer membrane protein assembly factor BamE [Alphaproteobacteria bacterium]
MMKFAHILTVSALLCGAAACAPTQAVRGNMVEDHVLATVQPGVDNAADVMRKMGSPTARDPFDPAVWYYIGQKTEKRGILDPKVAEERVLIARFSPEGTLESLTEREGGRNEIPVSREKTPTSGNEITFMQQLLGNLGKFNKDEVNPK